MTDNVNNPKHYTSHQSGVEAIEITRWLRGPYSNAFKYVFRGWDGLKDDPVQDLKKALWYLEDAENFPDDGYELHPQLEVKWYRYHDAEHNELKRACLAHILFASEGEVRNNPDTEQIMLAKKLIQERIAYLQSYPDVAL